MPDPRRPLTLYRVRASIDGTEVASFDQIIRPDLLSAPEITAFELSGDFDFDAKLFVLSPTPSVPTWLDFLKDGFSDAEVSESASSGAVLTARVSQGGNDRYFAFTFGTGRHMLRANAYERNRGLRVALNAMYDPTGTGGTHDPARIRSVDARTVAATTILTRRQTGRPAPFELFGVDIRRDLLGGITGRPVAQNMWGPRVTGSHAFKFSTSTGFEGLGQVCHQYLEAEGGNAYQERFGWIDNVREVNDPVLLAALHDVLLANLRQVGGTTIELAPPDIIDWDEVHQFKYPLDDQPRDELEMDHYLHVLEETNRLDGLTVQQLRQRHHLAALDDQGEELNRWSVFRCLEGEIEHSGETYLITAGAFFEVAPGYTQMLDQDIAAIPEYSGNLPQSHAGQSEGDYNKQAALNTASNLLLDKRLVQISSATSPIEFCDILTEDRVLIHVKRKARSSSLSHLFAQGSTSADLFLMNPEYRQEALNVIKAAKQDREDSEASPFNGRFSTFSTDGITPGDYEVVYAVIEKWNGQSFVGRLPFFSKVNLRRHEEDLRRMGFRVTQKRINVVD